MLTKEQAYQTIEQLTERFGEQILSYKKADYNETLARRDFIDPFFKALGWDVDNSQGYAEAYREVIHEDRVKIGGATKAPDYSFRLPGGKRLFFVEAKKPSVLVKEDVLPAYQVRRYAWSAKLSVSILTDFEELAVYDCTKKPFATDKASTARIKYLTYKDYLPQFDFLWDAFSKERVLKGSFDKYIAGDKNKKGTATVDAAFLASLDEWRKELAQNIALRNTDLNEDELNFAVQQMLDRLIFLRIAEDRSVEEYGRLKSIFAQKTTEPYNALLQQFYEADSKYNSGLFDFVKDTVSSRVSIDSKVLKGIINELYYPASPYEFSVLSVEILGSAYEQFLGKQIKLTAGHRAIIEEKPEVRKAGGVYYTPQYIVEYIVENTIGKIIGSPSGVGGKKPEDISKLKIVDPACGSGSFLLGAYEHLLKWHRQYYMPEFERLTAIAGSGDYTTKQRNDAIKDRSKLPLTPDGNLTTAIKKQILLNNLYGVDIDVQAVEVTKLSLLLKCMEGETGSSITAEMRFGERVLPTLDYNIKSGNSLVDMDFYDGQINFEPGAEKKVKPFSWQQAFPKVFKQGGFDAVIGNPPYVRQELLSDVKPYFQQKYKVYHGMADLYSYFFEKGIGLLNSNGLFGIIVANKWMRANYGEPLRKWFKQQPIKQIIDFGDLPVFQNATTYPCIIISGKANSAGSILAGGITVNVKTLAFENLQQYVTENRQLLTQEKFEDAGWNLGSETEQLLLKKLQQAGTPLGEYVKGKIYYGIKTGLNEAFVINDATKDALIKEDAKSAEVIKPFLAGRDVKRYQVPIKNSYLILFPKGFTNEKGSKPDNAWKWLSENYTAIAKYLYNYKEKAELRYDKGEFWWELRACEYYEKFEHGKIIIPAIVKNASYTFDTIGFYSNDKTSIIPTEDLFLLGVLNSKACDYFLKSIAATKQGGYFEYKPMYVSKLPIPKANKKNHDEIVKLVDTMLQLQQQKQNATLATEQEQLTQRIQYTDNAINQHVYTLYGLTADEIKIVEGV